MLENKYQFVSVPGGLLSLRVACPLSSLKPVLTWIAAIPNSLDLSNFTLPTGTWHPPPGLDCHGLLFWVHPTWEVRLWTASPYPQQEQRPLGKQQPPVGYGYRLQRGCISSTNGGCIMVFSLLRNRALCVLRVVQGASSVSPQVDGFHQDHSLHPQTRARPQGIDDSKKKKKGGRAWGTGRRSAALMAMTRRRIPQEQGLRSVISARPS